MSEAEEVVTGLFALVISGFVLIVAFSVINGYDVNGIVSVFIDLLPNFILGLVVLFILLRVSGSL